MDRTDSDLRVSKKQKTKAKKNKNKNSERVWYIPGVAIQSGWSSFNLYDKIKWERAPLIWSQFVSGRDKNIYQLPSPTKWLTFQEAKRGSLVANTSANEKPLHTNSPQMPNTSIYLHPSPY